MNLNKGDKVLCVENNSTVRPLVIESVGDKIVFSKQLDKGVKRTFSLKEGSFQLVKPRYISEHEKREYKNPHLERHDRVKVIHVEGTDNTNVLGRDGIVIAIKENERGDREVILWMEDTQETASLELEYRLADSELIQKSLVLKLDEPKAKEEDYYDDLLNLNLTPKPVNENTKEKISPDLEVGDRIMAWDISPDDIPPGGLPDGEHYIPPSTFIATVIEVLDVYDPRYENGIKYLVRIEDTGEEVGLYGGEWLGGSMYPIRDKYQPNTRDKWLKLPKLGITEESDVFGQGLLDPIEPEEFEGEDEEWEKMMADVEDDEKRGLSGDVGYEDITHLWSGEKTDPSKGFVAPSAQVTDNICKVKGFCEAQGPITFGQLKELVETATSKRIQADLGRGLFKTAWRIIPFFIPQILLAAVGVTVTRAINKIITPALTDTRGYKEWWGKIVLKAMDVAEGDYVPDITLGDDPLSKVFFISDGLLQMVKDKYKLKFARYVAEYAASRPDNEPVPDWFVENLLRDYLNQKFLLNPPLEPKEGTDFKALKEHDETEVEVSDNESYQKEFTKNQVRVLNYLSQQFSYEELKELAETDETELPTDLQTKWEDIIKLFGERTDYVDKMDYWVKSTRWAKWAVDNWSEACAPNSPNIPCDFKEVTNPIMDTPKMYRVAADESMWEKVFRSGETYVGAFDEDDAYDRADSAWYNYDVDMETYDYGDTDSEELNIEDPEYLHDIMEHEESRINPELEEGDTIIVVNQKETPRGYRSPLPGHMPELFTTYVVIEKRYSGHKSEYPYHYFLLPEDKYDIFINDPYAREVDDLEKSLFPWIHDWILDNEDIINEHNQRGINPELEVGDIIRVIDIDGEHANMPDRFGLYKVYEVMGLGGSQFAHYYQLSGETSEVIHDRLTNAKYLYRGDTWIYGDTPMATDVDRKTISEHTETQKLNPELMIGDEILVVSHGYERTNKGPELYTPYQVVSIKQDNNTQETYYGLYPLEQTDDNLLASILAGGGKPREILLYMEDNWILRPGFLRGEYLTEEIEFGGVWDYIFGDSIAVGLSMKAGEKHPGETGMEMRTKLGWSREGATPQEILRNIKEFIIENDLTNKKVLLSSGYSNGQDLGVISNVIDVLKGAGANVYLLGVSHTFPKEGDHNGILEEIANEKGVTFLGGFDAPNDDVHPNYTTLYSIISNTNESVQKLNEHAEGRNMKGFTPKLIGYLKFMIGTEGTNFDSFQRGARKFLDMHTAFSSALYLILMYNKKKHNFNDLEDLLNNLPAEDYEIPTIYEYEIVYYGEETSYAEDEECDNDGQGEYSGEDCDCYNAERPVEDEDGNIEYEECDEPGYGDCECMEWENKTYDLYMNEHCRKIILSVKKLEKTDVNNNFTFGYDEMYELEYEFGNENIDWVEEHSECEDDYDDATQWDYFNSREGDIIGLDTDVWKADTWGRYFESVNNKIYRVKPIEEQYDMVSQRDKKMTDLTSQIYNVLDNSFDLFEHPEGEIEYEGKNMALYSHDMKHFVPFDYIYNPIEQMLEGGIQQEDIEIFVEIITNWVTKNLSTPEETLNEEVNVLSDDTNYSKKDYEDFVDFAHKELKIEKDCPIDVEAEKSTEYTTGNYHIHDKKIKVLDNGRKLADILRTIAHELVHHKQNELGMLGGPIPEIGGPIEDQANAYAGRLVKKYGKQKPNLYMESRINVISEEKVVGFNNPTNNFVVIAGGPGAGKSFITRNLINLDNVKEFNVDQVRVMTAKKLWGDEWEEKISTEEGYDEILRRTFTTSDPRNLTVKHLKQFLQQERNQPVNVVYDAGGGQEQVMKDVHTLAKENGFNTTLVYVRTPLDVAQERNIERPRSLPPEMVAQYHQQVKDNMRNMIPIFDNVWTVDNKEMIDLAKRPTDNIEKLK